MQSRKSLQNTRKNSAVNIRKKKSIGQIFLTLPNQTQNQIDESNLFSNDLSFVQHREDRKYSLKKILRENTLNSSLKQPPQEQPSQVSQKLRELIQKKKIYKKTSINNQKANSSNVTHLTVTDVETDKTLYETVNYQLSPVEKTKNERNIFTFQDIYQQIDKMQHSKHLDQDAAKLKQMIRSLQVNLESRQNTLQDMDSQQHRCCVQQKQLTDQLDSQLQVFKKNLQQAQQELIQQITLKQQYEAQNKKYQQQLLQQQISKGNQGEGQSFMKEALNQIDEQSQVIIMLQQEVKELKTKIYQLKGHSDPYFLTFQNEDLKSEPCYCQDRLKIIQQQEIYIFNLKNELIAYLQEINLLNGRNKQIDSQYNTYQKQIL